MCSFKLFAENGERIVTQIHNGQNALYAGGDPAYAAIIVEPIVTGGYGTSDPTRIEFKDANGNYITLHNKSVVMYPDGAEEYRKFEVAWLGCNKIALKGANGLYVSRESDGSNKLQASREQIGPWEIFTVVPIV
jgi:Fascin domain